MDITKKIRAIELRIDSLNSRGFKQKKETQEALDAIKQHCCDILDSVK